MLKITNIKQLQILLTKRYVSYFDESMENEYDDNFDEFFNIIARNYSLLMLTLKNYKSDVSFECYYDNTDCDETIFIFKKMDGDKCYCWGIDDYFSFDEISENLFLNLWESYLESHQHFAKYDDKIINGGN